MANIYCTQNKPSYYDHPVETVWEVVTPEMYLTLLNLLETNKDKNSKGKIYFTSTLNDKKCHVILHHDRKCDIHFIRVSDSELKSINKKSMEALNERN